MWSPLVCRSTVVNADSCCSNPEVSEASLASPFSSLMAADSAVKLRGFVWLLLTGSTLSVLPPETLLPGRSSTYPIAGQILARVTFRSEVWYGRRFLPALGYSSCFFHSSSEYVIACVCSSVRRCKAVSFRCSCSIMAKAFTGQCLAIQFLLVHVNRSCHAWARTRGGHSLLIEEVSAFIAGGIVVVVIVDHRGCT